MAHTHSRAAGCPKDCPENPEVLAHAVIDSGHSHLRSDPCQPGCPFFPITKIHAHAADAPCQPDCILYNPVEDRSEWGGHSHPARVICPRECPAHENGFPLPVQMTAVALDLEVESISVCVAKISRLDEPGRLRVLGYLNRRFGK
jgi:hypothetical protein